MDATGSLVEVIMLITSFPTTIGATGAMEPLKPEGVKTFDDKVDSIGAGANFTLVPEKWFLDFFYRYQKVDGNNALESGPALRPDGAEDISDYDDTKINFVSAQVRCKFAKSWTVGIGGFYEDFGWRRNRGD